MNELKKYLSILGFIDKSMTTYQTCLLVDDAPQNQSNYQPSGGNSDEYDDNAPRIYDQHNTPPFVINVNNLSIKANGDYITISDRLKSISFYRGIIMFKTHLDGLCQIDRYICERYRKEIDVDMQIAELECAFAFDMKQYNRCLIKESFTIFVDKNNLYEVKVKLQSKTNTAIIAQQLKWMINQYDSM